MWSLEAQYDRLGQGPVERIRQTLYDLFSENSLIAMGLRSLLEVIPGDSSFFGEERDVGGGGDLELKRGKRLDFRSDEEKS